MRFDSDMSLLISASIIKKSSGPKTVPWGTSLSTGESPLIAPGSLTKWDRLVRKFKKTMELSSNSAAGPDGIPPSLLLNCAYFIIIKCLPIAHLVI